MKSLRCIFISTAVIFLYAALGATCAKPGKNPKSTGFTNVPIENLAAEFREIRRIKSHFDGGKWTEDVDQWNGRKHRLMTELGIRLAAGKYHKSDIIRFLLPPDQIAQKGDDLFGQIMARPHSDSSDAGSIEFLFYYWRGTHDFLYFTCQNNVIIDSGWWYALE